VRLLTFLSDFGSGSPYAAAMKAVAAGLCDALQMDISHDVRPAAIGEAAYLLWSVVPSCPEGSVHCVVVDPGVGTARAALAIAAGAQRFVGPDNGVLLPAARRAGVPAVYRLSAQPFWRTPVSATFHGRDIFAPTAARLAAGASVASVGAPADAFVDFVLPVGRRTGRALAGEVLWIDRFGNLVTSLPGDLLGEAPAGTAVLVRTPSGRLAAAAARTFGDVPAGAALVYTGSDGLVEVGINRGSAASALGAAIGTAVEIVPA
jgi:S-adenosylmethionine hydrolase